MSRSRHSHNAPKMPSGSKSAKRCYLRQIHRQNRAESKQSTRHALTEPDAYLPPVQKHSIYLDRYW